MHPCAALLDEALEFARKEEQALREEDVDLADELSVRREELLLAAWQNRRGCDESSLLDKLTLMQTLQGRLEGLARDLYEKLRVQLGANRKQEKYFAGNRYAIAQAQRSYYFSKTS